MKKLFIAMLAVIATATVFTSCKSDDKDDATSALAGNTYAASASDLAANEDADLLGINQLSLTFGASDVTMTQNSATYATGTYTVDGSTVGIELPSVNESYVLTLDGKKLIFSDFGLFAGLELKKK